MSSDQDHVFRQAGPGWGARTALDVPADAGPKASTHLKTSTRGGHHQTRRNRSGRFDSGSIWDSWLGAHLIPRGTLGPALTQALTSGTGAGLSAARLCCARVTQ